MSNFTTEEIELAKVLHNAIPADHGIRIETILLNQARAALKWCAEHPQSTGGELKHFAITPFVAYCGANVPSQTTTTGPHRTNCPDCIERMKKALKPMSDEERMEKIGMVWRDTECTERHVLEESLVKAGLIPPRRERSIGEIVRDIVLKSDPSLAAGKIDELLGKLVELAKAAQVPERDAYDQYYDWHHRIKAKAEDALAPIEALKAVQKKE